MSNVTDIDCLLRRFVEEGLSGCGLEIKQRGETLYEGYFGCSDIASGKKVSKASVFRQASLSKLPLYTVLMMLYERGEFLLTDPVSDYFPEWKESKRIVRHTDGSFTIQPTLRPINISDLLTMRCGLPYCNFPAGSEDPVLKAMEKCMKPLWEKGHYTLREHIAVMAEAPLAFEPGEHWLYGFSSELAAGIVEAVSGKAIEEVFRELLFEPLEMEDTGAHYFRDIQERMVTLYQRTEEGELIPAVTPFDEKHIPGPEHQCGWARLFSTVNDYSKLVQMLANGGEYKGKRLMGRKTIDLMRTNVLNQEQLKEFSNGYNAGYGYGYGVRTLLYQGAGHHNGTLQAFGWTGGFGTWCEADPEEGLSIVYMHNLIPSKEEYYHPRIRAAAYGLLR